MASPPDIDKDRDRRRVGDLYRRYAAWLKRAVRGRVRPDQSEDLVQEVYLRLMSSGTEAEIRHPKALLMRVAVNASVDARRRSRLHTDPACRGDSVTDASQPPLQDETILLKQIIVSLPTPLRDVFVLSRFADLTYEQIADHLGVSVKTIEWRMSKALALCARALAIDAQIRPARTGKSAPGRRGRRQPDP